MNGSNGASKRSNSDSDLSSEEDAPLIKRQRPSAIKDEDSDGSDSDSDAPLGSTSGAAKRANGTKAGVKKEESSDDDSGSDSDAPLTTKKPLNGKSNGLRGRSVKSGASTPAGGSDNDDDEESDEEEEDEEEDDDDDDGASRTSSGKRKKQPKMSVTGKGGQKWTTLYHTGPRFPPPHEPLPSHIKLKYDGKPVDLDLDAEEAAYFYAVKLETQHARDAVFNKNFFSDFKEVLKKHPPRNGIKIERFDKLDFRAMYDFWKEGKDAEKEKKKNTAPSLRKKQTEEKKRLEDEMKTCIVDGVMQRVGNVMVEPPALFLGRGEHPKKGRIKRRVPPEAITLNHTLNDPDHPPPAPPAGHKWKEIREDKSSTWLAFWIENINGQYKYMYLDSASTFKSNSDRDKFEKARRLDKCIVKLRRHIDERLTSKQRFERQLGTVVWLIDNYSLRAGNEKGEDEAATYGVCSLLVQHVKDLIDSRCQVKLEFLGKDSMQFKETLTVPERIFKNFKMFTQSTRRSDGSIGTKKDKDEIFDKVDPSQVNKFLQNPANGGMKGLSAKVFRTYNASTTFQGLLNKTEENLKALGQRPNPQNLRDQYNQANRLVAILCNHQKTINPLQSEKANQRFEERMLGIRYERFKERQRILTAGKATQLKKDYPKKSYEWAKHWDEILAEVDITPEQIKDHEERIIENKKRRIQDAYTRYELEMDYAKQQAGASSPTKPKGKKSRKSAADDDVDGLASATLEKYKGPKTKAELAKALKELDDELKELEKERKTNKSRLGSGLNVASAAKKLLGKIAQAEKVEAEQETKNKTSDVSLGTSKLNYIDPRITVAWLKKWDAKLVQLNGGSKASNSSPAKKSGKRVKKEESDDEDVKPAAKRGKGASGDAISKKGVKAEPVESNQKTANSDKMELDLKVLVLGQYFPATMQKKFKWAAQEDDGSDLSPEWVFVDDAEKKIRDNMSSARRNGGIDEDDEESSQALADLAKAQSVVKDAKEERKEDRKKAAATTKSPARKAALKKDSSDDEDSSDDDKPLGQIKK